MKAVFTMIHKVPGCILIYNPHGKVYVSGVFGYKLQFSNIKFNLVVLIPYFNNLH